MQARRCEQFIYRLELMEGIRMKRCRKTLAADSRMADDNRSPTEPKCANTGPELHWWPTVGGELGPNTQEQVQRYAPEPADMANYAKLNREATRLISKYVRADNKDEEEVAHRMKLGLKGEQLGFKDVPFLKSAASK